MKKLLIILGICFCFLSVSGQAFIGEPQPEGGKPNYHYIILWRTWNQAWAQSGDLMSAQWKWQEDHLGFNDLKELLNWMNIKENQWVLNTGEEAQKPHYTTRITENQLIGVYDLNTAKRINIVFKEEKKSTPKKIVVDADEWTDKKIEIK